MSDALEAIFEFIFEYAFEGFFGNTGRLVIKAITFGQVDLDLDRFFHCFFAVIVGFIFWGSILAGMLYWKFGHLLMT